MATSKTTTPEPQAPEPVADERPRILAFFERVGLVKGRNYRTVTTTSGGAMAYFGPAVIEEIAAIGEAGAVMPAEIVIIFSEPGMQKKRYVRYSQLVSWYDD